MPKLVSNIQKSPETVDEALDRFWRDRSLPGHVPDYAGFMNWFQAKVKALMSSVPLPLHAQTTLPSKAQLDLELIEAAKAAGIEITKEGGSPDPAHFGKPIGKMSKLKAFNRGKLLLSLLKDISPRWRETLFMMAMPTEQLEQWSSVEPSSSQLQHRNAFFRAVAVGDERTAAKMLGRLREEEHDIGELNFLEATESFHSRHYTEAIEHARRVPKTGIDWPRAFMLILETYALQGTIDAIEAEIQTTPSFVFPQFFISYVCQVAIENSDAPERSLECAKSIINDTVGRSQPGLGAFHMWNRHTCQVAAEFVEHQQELALRDLAVDQSANRGKEQLKSARSLRSKQVECALIVDSNLAQKLYDSDPENAFTEIVKQLMNWPHPGSEEYQECFLQALVAQWRIGPRWIFVDNVVANLDVLVKISNDEVWQIIGWAYQESLVLQRRADTKLLEQKLRSSPTMARRLTQLAALSAVDRLDRQLSPMGRLAVRAANWDLSQAEVATSIWRDAGMISLGFFRILELEFNERLIFPMIKTLDLEALEEKLAVLKSEEPNKTVKKAIEFWQRMIGSLNKAKTDHKGLELGALEALLQKSSDVSGVDRSLKTIVNSALSLRLSAAGLDALRSGELGMLLNPSERERFRNPGAHARYVDLGTARECKRYVENALEKLIAYCIDETVKNPTIH